MKITICDVCKKKRAKQENFVLEHIKTRLIAKQGTKYY